LSVYARLETERPHPRTRDLDRVGTLEVLRRLQVLDREILPAVAAERASLARAVEIVARAFRAGGRLFLFGAGTSGRLAVLEAAECPPTFGTPPSRVQAVMAGGRGAVFRSREGAEDDGAAARREARRRVRPGDVVVGVAASGITPFTRAAIEEARRLGCRTILVTSNRRPARGGADVVLCPRVGPEALAGSTRMKSGTAAKMVLNQLTTAAMVRTGGAYRNWMVDLRPSSAKLRDRSRRIVQAAAGVSPARAGGLLKAAGGHVKTAILMGAAGAGAAEARRRLKAAGGSLGRALGEFR